MPVQPTIIAQKTHKHKVLLLVQVGLAVFLVVIFIGQYAKGGQIKPKMVAYKQLNQAQATLLVESFNGQNGTNLALPASLSASLPSSFADSLSSSHPVSAPAFEEKFSSAYFDYLSIKLSAFLLIVLSSLLILFREHLYNKMREVTRQVIPRAPAFN